MRARLLLLLCFAAIALHGRTLADDAFVLDARCVIQHAPDAPQFTVDAASELRRVLARATGLELAISTETTAARGIRLVSDATLPPDGFEIRVEKERITIAGHDSEPRAMWDVPCHGTVFGALEFLEHFVGVRWLFPGELGEDVPQHDTLRMEPRQPLRGAPALAVRSLAYIGESERDNATRHAPVLDWMNHQRLSNGLHPHLTGYGHSWDDYLKPADLEAHPEWKSTNSDGVRNGKVTFFCSTAPGLVELFAKRVIETMDRNPKREMSSISPTDGGGFCACERCKKLIDTDPHGKPNHARAMLTFYQQVGEIIARERPGRRLGGFVYYNYQYPPDNAPKLPDNLSLCWAPLNYYGYGLLKLLYRDEFEGVMTRWSRITPHFFYHNYSTWMRSFHGAPLPVSLDILKHELPAAARHHAWGARMVGSSAWGINAPINYLLAKQMWDAALDVSAVLDDWLARAYGPGGRHLRALYDELDARMRAHKEAEPPAYKGSQYEVNENVMQSIYAPLFPAMEQRYRTALAACETEVQRKRLAMFGDNLTQLHFALRKAGLITGDANSLFYRDDAAFTAFLEQMKTTLSLESGPKGIYTGPIWKGEWSAP